MTCTQKYWIFSSLTLSHWRKHPVLRFNSTEMVLITLHTHIHETPLRMYKKNAKVFMKKKNKEKFSKKVESLELNICNARDSNP